jgi:hypothetical protein
MSDSPFNKLTGAVRQFAAAFRAGPDGAGWDDPGALALRESLFARYPFTEEAKVYLRRHSHIAVRDLHSTSGGGYWDPGRQLVFLNTAQDEAALHEHAHVWWHERRLLPGQAGSMIDAVVRFSEDGDPRYAQAHKLAYDYVHGIPAQGWAGMLVERNDWEMFAGLASGTMGDMRLLPPYVREFYVGLFQMPAGR